MESVNASEFKARCLALLDRVYATRKPITILKRGRPVAQLTPPLRPEQGYPQDELRGSVEVLGDIVAPVLPAATWEAESGRS